MRDALHPRQGQAGLRAEGRRVPQVLVADGDEHRRPEVLPRPHVLARARALGPADDRPRSSTTIGAWGRDGGYFATEDEAQTFEDELKAILVNQLAAFNSPVWFNVGFEEKPQCSACFILSIEDSMDVDPRLDPPRGDHLPRRLGLGRQPLAAALVEGAALEGRLRLRPGLVHARRRRLRRARSSRAARRGARRRWSSSTSTTPTSRSSSGARRKEEEKARVLEAAGYDMSLDSPDWASIQYQNANNSVRVSDAFMEAAETRRRLEPDRAHRRHGRRDASTARELLRQIAEAAWRCADPGVQYDTTINAWHTLPNTGRINASNPCSEYMSIDDSRLQPRLAQPDEVPPRGRRARRRGVRARVDVMFLAQEILVGNSSYPTPEIERNAKAYRQLGLGYANLGALLMARGLPYDSDEGRAYAAAITALMTGRAYRKSAEIAGRMGAVRRLPPERGRDDRRDREAPRGGRQHRRTPTTVPGRPARRGARKSWDDALDLGEVNGYRNAQATVLAPTGTISFMMDCDTTGRRARLLARQVEEARRRRRDHDRQQDRRRSASRSSATRRTRSTRSSPTSTSATPSSARRT